MTKVWDLAIPQRLLLIHIILEAEKEAENENVMENLNELYDIVMQLDCNVANMALDYIHVNLEPASVGTVESNFLIARARPTSTTSQN